MKATETPLRATSDKYNVVAQLCLSRLRGCRRFLKEGEFLTLSLLRTNQSMTVGDIAHVLGFLPATMSRIISKLDNKVLIKCSINPRDKRRIDVCLTPHGEQVILDCFNRIIKQLQESFSGDLLEDALRVLAIARKESP